jgi:predicted permease
VARIPNSSNLTRDFGANAAIVLLLAFGLGTAALLYTALDRLLLNPLPGIHAESLVRVAVKRPQVVSRGFSLDTYDAVRQMKSFNGVAAEAQLDTTVTGVGGLGPAAATVPERVTADMVSGSYFSVMSVSAERGRTLNNADEQPGADIVPVVLSHRFWLRRFGVSPSILGTTIALQGHSFMVVGITPAHFYGTAVDASPDMFLPFAAQGLLSNKTLRDPQSDRAFHIIARLRPGVTRAQAEAEFEAVYSAQRLAEKDANPGQGIVEPVAFAAFGLHDQFTRALTLLLWGLAAFLVILCANVAGLLLARAVRRERETAIRVALGARPGTLATHALIDALTLALLGAAGGLLAAYTCAPALLRLLPHGTMPLPVSLAPDAKVAALSFALAIAISLVFGVTPALYCLRVAPQHSLRGGRSTRRVGSTGRALLTMQIGLTLVLLVASGLLIRTFQALRNTGPGFNTEHIVTFTLDASMAGTTAPPSPALPTELQRRVRSLPGVEDAGLATAALMRRIGLKTSVARPGEKIALESFLNTSFNDVSDSYFSTLQIPIVEGRSFEAGDSEPSQPAPVMINQAFARMLFPDDNALGKTFGQGGPGETATSKYVVIGIAGDSKYRSLREVPPPIFYSPLQQRLDWDSTMLLYVRTSGSPTAVIGAVRKTLAALDARLPFYDVITMHEQVAESLWQERLLAALATVFSLASLAMAAAGLYGLLAYDTNQRTREFGIRAAIGASRRQVALLLVRDILRIVIPGLVAGLIVCFFLSRLIAATLYGIRPFDPLTLSSAFLLVASIGILAGWRPVIRAMGVDPAIVLRDE